jgi:hypothetical protein
MEAVKMGKKLTLQTIAISALALAISSFGYMLAGARTNQNDSGAVEPDQSQAEVLRDGVVTWAEHEAAIRRTADCLSNSGVRVEVQPAEGRKPSTLGFGVATLDDGSWAEARLAECKTKHLSEVEATWISQSQPTAAEFAEARDWFVTCMTDRGLEAVGEREAQMLAWARSTEPEIVVAWARCATEQNTIFGFVP